MFRSGLLICCVLLASHLLSAGGPLEISAELQAVLSQRFPKNVEDLRLLQTQVQKVAGQVVSATVGIEVGGSVGSGVLVDAKGLILTAAHVIGGPNRQAIVILADGRRLKAHTLGAHHKLDAGMVQLDEVPNDVAYVPVVSQEPSTQPDLIGQWVVATGQPGGILDDRSPPVRLGRVLAADDEWICTDCTLVGGDSGGPLFNMRSEVIAIHMSIGPAAVHNFHVPISEVQPFWQKLLAGEVWGRGLIEDESDVERSMLGIAARMLDEKCVVTQVFSGFAAKNADIRPGDIILSLDDEKIGSLAQLAKLIASKQLGDEAVVVIERDDRELSITIAMNTVSSPWPGSIEPATNIENSKVEP